MADDTITHETTIATPEWWDDAVGRVYNEDILRPLRVAWRDAGCTSKVRRTPDGYVVEVSGPVHSVLDAIRDINDLPVTIRRVDSMRRALEKVSARVSAVLAEGHDFAFLCPRGHVFGAFGEAAQRMHEKLGAPRCLDCGEKTVTIKK